ncbi:MAG: zinc ribbon domain-containing protein [Candidatus Aureabacteria bacterium]|nr:zinc ribbon domain-containing protein [Candidatus Auribacterota bacterium]
MINKIVRFIRREYALIIVCAAFLYFAVTFIAGVFNYYKVKMAKKETIYDTFLEPKDSMMETMRGFRSVLKGDKKQAEVTVALDITDRFMKTAETQRHKKIECWQCGKMIPFEKTVCPYCGAIQKHTDSDKDGMPDYWEIRYSFDPEDETDAAEDADGDKYVNLEEYRAGSDPTNSQDTPVTKKFVYEVKKIFRKPVDILFRGYIELADKYTLEINWEGRGKTFFAEVGDVIRGYTIQEFKKIIREVSKPEKGVVIDVDESFIILQRKGAQEPIKLVKNKVFIEREVNARLQNKETKKEIDVHIGSVFEAIIDGKKEEFTVTDITIDQVFYQDKKGNINFIFWKD